jgi:chromatin assembly factor 1 subunit A
MEDTKPEPAKPTFNELFLPFRVKKGTTLAPINYFDQEVTIIEPGVSKKQGKGSFKGMWFSIPMKWCRPDLCQDMNFLETFKSSIPASSKPRATTYPRLHSSAPPLKTTNRLSVQDLVDQLNDATMAGDVNGAKALISTLSDRKKLPVRWFHFWDNTRPMWVGTWTKTARNVGPRTPFGKEDGVDYEYDSGEDWVEEEEGEEMEDTETMDGEDEEDEEEDNRDWIVDDDEEELEHEDEGLVLSLDEIGPGVVALPSSKGKRKADGIHGWSAKSGNKRRKLVPLKPDCKGPFWESKIGLTQTSSWSRYSIRVLNGVY